MPKVHYAILSETCPLVRASGQVSDRFAGVSDRLAVFCRDSQMDFEKRPDNDLFDTSLVYVLIYLLCVMTKQTNDSRCLIYGLTHVEYFRFLRLFKTVAAPRPAARTRVQQAATTSSSTSAIVYVHN